MWKVEDFEPGDRVYVGGFIQSPGLVTRVTADYVYVMPDGLGEDEPLDEYDLNTLIKSKEEPPDARV